MNITNQAEMPQAASDWDVQWERLGLCARLWDHMVVCCFSCCSRLSEMFATANNMPCRGTQQRSVESINQEEICHSVASLSPPLPPENYSLAGEDAILTEKLSRISRESGRTSIAEPVTRTEGHWMEQETRSTRRTEKIGGYSSISCRVQRANNVQTDDPDPGPVASPDISSTR